MGPESVHGWFQSEIISFSLGLKCGGKKLCHIVLLLYSSHFFRVSAHSVVASR